MKTSPPSTSLATLSGALTMTVFWTLLCGAASGQMSARWKAHDLTRPRPPVVTPAPEALPVPAPPDAVVLFDGRDLSNWLAEDGGPAGWRVEGSEMVVVPGADDIHTARPFGDVQLHLEWATPSPATGSGQGRGNSGVFLMGLYELQVLDSYENDTYPDGQAASIYGQYPPLVNACRPPGQWQSYDIVFRRPRFDPDGKLLAAARLTVFHNGLLVQDSRKLWGPTMWLQHLPYHPHPDKLPLTLQEHGNAVRYRNIWLRELSEFEEPGPPRRPEPAAITLPEEILQRYVGRYTPGPGSKSVYTVTLEDGQLRCHFYWNKAAIDLIPRSPREFALRWTAATVVFDLDASGIPTAMIFHLAGSAHRAERMAEAPRSNTGGTS